MGFVVFMLIDVVSRARGMFRRNPARVALRRVVRGLTPLHPRLLASKGDSGRGIENRQPWFESYLVVDGVATIEQAVTAAAGAAGYELRRTSATELVGERAGRTLRATLMGPAPVHAARRGRKRAGLSLSMVLPSR
jgi:hypothetical protein